MVTAYPHHAEGASILGRWGNKISKLNESCTSNPKSETSDWTKLRTGFLRVVQFEVSDFGFEVI